MCNAIVNQPLFLPLFFLSDITVANVSFSTCKNGHFETHVNLLPGATGIVIRLFDSKKTFVVQQKIHRNDQDSILMNNSKKLDPGNYTIKIHYLNKDGSFDTLSNITNDHTLHCTLEDDESSTPTTNITDSNGNKVFCVLAIINLIFHRFDSYNSSNTNSTSSTSYPNHSYPYNSDCSFSKKK